MDVRPGYKQTEVGVIPLDWAVRPFGELTTTVASGRSRVGAAYGSYPVHGSTGVIGSCEEPEYEGDAVLVARVGANAGTLRIVSGKYGVTDNTIIVRVKSGSCLSFFWRQLESKNLNTLVFGSGQPLLTGSQLKAFTVCEPPLPEQRAIAAALSDVDALLAKLDQFIAKKRDLKQAALQQLLTAQTRLPGFNEAWEVKLLGDVSPLQRGFDLLAIRVRQGCYPVVYSNGVLNYHNEFMVKGPGVVTGRSGTIGNVHYIDDNFWPHNTSLWVTSFKGNSPRFIYYLLGSLGLERFGSGSGVPTLNRNDVHAHRVLIPPTLDEQSTIATVLSDIDAELASLEQRRDKTRALKQGMMQELLTGRIRLV